MHACGPARCSPHAHTRRHTRISYPRPVPRLLQREGVLRFDTSVGGGRATTFSARRKVRDSRDRPNPAPKALDPGPAGTRSQLVCGLPCASMRLESATNGVGSTAHLPGLAAAASSTSVGLGAARQRSPREVRAERPHTATRARTPARQRHRHCSCRHAALATRPCRPRPTCQLAPRVRSQRRRGVAATARRRGPRARPTVAGARRNGRYRPPRARAGGRQGRRRAQWSGRRPWKARSGGRRSWGGVGAASPPSRPRSVAPAGRRREIGTIRGLWRLRGGSERPQAGQAVVPGHGGTGRCVGDPS